MKKIDYLIAGLIIFSGLLIRFQTLRDNFAFSGDEEIAAFASRQILFDHKLTLIGPEASVGRIFVGPAIVYLQALIYWFFKMNPWGIAYFATLFSGLTMSLLYYTAVTVFSKPTAQTALLLYAFLPRIINYDRLAWNLNTLMFTALVVFLSLYKIRSQFSKKTWYFILGAAAGFGFHLHPQAFLFLPTVFLIFCFWQRNLKLKFVGYFFISFLISISPLILFDLRHDFFNLRGILSFFGKNSFPSAGFTFYHLRSITVFLQEVSQTFLIPFYLFTVLLIGFAFLMAKDRLRFLFLCWLSVPVIFFGFYQKRLPAYYFLYTLPVILLYFANVLVKAVRFRWRITFTAFLFLFICLQQNILTAISRENPHGLKYKTEVVQEILAKSSVREKSKILISGNDVDGYRYLFWYLAPKYNKKFEDLEIYYLWMNVRDYNYEIKSSEGGISWQSL